MYFLEEVDCIGLLGLCIREPSLDLIYIVGIAQYFSEKISGISWRNDFRRLLLVYSSEFKLPCLEAIKDFVLASNPLSEMEFFKLF